MSVILQQQTFAAADWGAVFVSSGTATVTQQFAFAVALTGTLAPGATVNVVEQNPSHTILALTCVGIGANNGFVLVDGSGNDYLFANATLSIGAQVAATAQGFASYQAPARNLVWTGAHDSNFANAGNWNDTSNATNPAGTAPGGADTAQFLSGGGTIAGTGTAAALQFGGSALWDLTLSASIGAATGVTVGQGGTGSLLVSGGADISSFGTLDMISGAASKSASVTVDGTGSTWSSANELIVGNLGSGSFVISNAAGLSASATASTPAMVLGAASGGNGLLSVAGTGSRATLAGQVNVGQAGAGSLTVQNQGTVITGGTTSAPSQGIDIAQAGGGTGSITVTGTQSLLANTGEFIVGDAGVGSLTIQSGGTVVTSPGGVAGLAGMVIANSASASSSAVTVTGPGSQLTISGTLVVGVAGTGALSISQGATVSVSSIDSASAASGAGVITVAGPGSALALTSSLTVGDKAAGELSILNGATVSALSISVGNASTASSGNVDVEGAGSTLHVLPTGSLNIGVAGGGSGILTIGTNATLQFNGTIVEAGRASLNNNGGVIDPDAVLLTSASNAGTGLNQYDLYVDNLGAVQIVGGTGTWDTPMLLTGSAVADAANNINNGSLGQWQLSQGGTLVINANTVDAGQVIIFEDNTDTLVIGQLVNGGGAGVSGQVATVVDGAENLLQAGGFQAAIWGYQAGDNILFNNLPVVSDQILNGNTLELLGAGNTDLGSLTFFTKAGNKPLGVTAMAAAAAQMACFAEGTLIETVDGPRAVETLAVGDAVVTLLGGPGRIVWVGSRAVDCTRHPQPVAVWPVRIAAGAFGEGLPVRDLYVSPDHAIYIDNVLIPAKHLVNGTTIAQVQRRHVVYHHIELARHDVVLAEGLPAESYLETGDRANFSQNVEMIRLFPDFVAPMTADAGLLWEARGCAELLVTGNRLDALRRRISRCAVVTVHDRLHAAR